MPVSIIGSIVGVYSFSNLPIKIISPVFGILLVFLAFKSFFSDKINKNSVEKKISLSNKLYKFKLLFISSLAQGAFGTGGPFAVNALKKDFKNKSSLRATMAFYFLFCNFLRAPQLIISKDFNWQIFCNIWWIIIPVFLAIFLGHKVHLKIDENYFKKGIGFITLIAGIKFILT